MRKVPPASRPVPSALDELLATEQGIAERVAAAAREIEALLAKAREEATAQEHEAAEALAVDLAALDAGARVAREAAVREIEQEAARVVQRFRTLTDVDVARLAAGAVADATGLVPAGAP